MGGKNKSYQNTQQADANLANQQQQAVFNQMQADSPQLKWLKDIFSRGSAWIDGKDFSKAPPGMFNYDLNAPEQRRKMREANMNMQQSGAYALGGQNANPTMLALSRQRLDAMADEDQAANYEDAVNDYMREIKGLGADLNDFEFSKNNALLGNATSRWNAASGRWGEVANRPSPWWGVLGAGIGAAGSMASAYAGKPR